MTGSSPTPRPSASSSPDVAALQRALAAEHAAVWAYGVVGAHLDGARQRLARRCLDEHLAWRDRLEGLVSSAGATPVAAQPAYALPGRVGDAAAATALALQVEDRAAAVWADVLAALRPGRRRLAAQALRDTALRAATWRGHSVPFPGLPERSSSAAPASPGTGPSSASPSSASPSSASASAGSPSPGSPPPGGTATP